MQLRVARHTSNLKAILDFYTTVLGLDLLGEFHDHDGYDGIFLGHKNSTWHLEFTTSEGTIKQSYNEEDALVFYPEDKAEYEVIMEQLKIYGIIVQRAKNPYWNMYGKLILDPDDFPVIISKQKI